MYWAEVTMRDSNTKRFERNTLNEIYELAGKYIQRNRKGTKATAIKFGHDDVQTGIWNPIQGIKAV